MICRICGHTEGIKYYTAKRQALCNYCATGTPQKVSRASFDNYYWEKPHEVPEGVKRDFYDDYITSQCNLKQYKEQTTETII